MFDTYQEIFERRANIYHRAMVNFPHVRKQEFEHAVTYLALEPGNRLCDVPSGGGYLASYVATTDISFVFVETGSAFSRYCPVGSNFRTVESALDNLPLQEEVIDRMVSLAAIHHVEDKKAIFGEFYRVLKPTSRLVIADVEEGSNTASFLNGFVDQFNSMGHKGLFLNADAIEKMRGQGFDILSVERPKITWSFGSVSDLTSFFKDLFGLDKASDQDILDGVNQYFTLSNKRSQCSIDWQLAYITAVKPD